MMIVYGKERNETALLSRGGNFLKLSNVLFFLVLCFLSRKCRVEFGLILTNVLHRTAKASGDFPELKNRLREFKYREGINFQVKQFCERR